MLGRAVEELRRWPSRPCRSTPPAATTARLPAAPSSSVTPTPLRVMRSVIVDYAREPAQRRGGDVASVALPAWCSHAEQPDLPP
jgi:hypothetical protein